MLFTSPEAIFDRVVADGYAGIERLAREGAEHQSLEFKTTNSAEGKVQDEDRRILGKAISALANGSGGVIIIGIYVKGPKRELRPIRRLLEFADHLNETVRDMVDPQISVLTERVETPDASDEGFVVIGVPNAFPKPFMSRHDNVFYMRRSGASVAIKETSTIRGLVTLGARAEAEVWFRWATEGAVNIVRRNVVRRNALGNLANITPITLRVATHYEKLYLTNIGSIPIRELSFMVELEDGEFERERLGYRSQNITERGADGQLVEKTLHSLDGTTCFPGMVLVLGECSMRRSQPPGPKDLRCTVRLFFEEREEGTELEREFDPLPPA